MKSFKSKLLTFILWGLIAFFVVLGINSIINAPTINSVKASVETERDLLTYQVKEEVELKSFAENVAMEYLTFYEKDESYADRINSFGYPISVDSSKLKGTLIAQNVSTQKVEKVAKNQYNVYVKVMVKNDNTIENYGLIVPVFMNDTTIRLDGVPSFNEIEKIETVEGKTFNLKPLEDEKLVNEISTQVSNFLKTYYEGSQSQLSVYLTSNNTDTLALNGSVTLVDGKIDSTIYSLEQGTYLTLVKTEVMLPNGSLLTQYENVILVKQDDKYLVQSINPRITNLYDILEINEEN